MRVILPPADWDTIAVMMRPLLLLACSLACAGIQSGRATAADPPVRVLIVDGVSNHDWKLTTALIRGILEPTGLFTVTVSTGPGTKDSPDWATCSSAAKPDSSSPSTPTVITMPARSPISSAPSSPGAAV